jgi:hypothetical protein
MGWRYSCWVLSLIAANAVHVGASSLPVIDRNGQEHVRAADLERDAGIVVKGLPGQKQVVVCSGERCASLKDFIDDGGDLLVRIEPLAKALGATARFDDARRRVGFEFVSGRTVSSSTARVGQLVPELRLRKLDGSWVALSDFRGKRVLINSWGSW